MVRFASFAKVPSVLIAEDFGMKRIQSVERSLRQYLSDNYLKIEKANKEYESSRTDKERI